MTEKQERRKLLEQVSKKELIGIIEDQDELIAQQTGRLEKPVNAGTFTESAEKEFSEKEKEAIQIVSKLIVERGFKFWVLRSKKPN